MTYTRKWFYGCILAIVLLSVALYATGAVREGDPPPVSNALPAVCLSGATVCTYDDPMRGDFNNNGQLDAGDLVIMQRAVLGL